MKRDSSPPDAIRVSGPNGAPGLVETSNSTRSVPDGTGFGGGDRGAEARRVELQRCKLGQHRRVEPRGRVTTSQAQARRRTANTSVRARLELPVQRLDMLAAGVDRRELRAHLFAERRQRVGLDAVLAGEAADVEQPRLDLLQPRGIEGERVGRAGDPVLGLARLRSAPGRATRAPRRAADDRPRRARSGGRPGEAATARLPSRRATRRGRSAIRRP